MRVRIDQESCIGSGHCAWDAPEVFRLGEEGVSEVTTPEPPAELHEMVQRAVWQCPGQAIEIVDDDKFDQRPQPIGHQPQPPHVQQDRGS